MTNEDVLLVLCKKIKKEFFFFDYEEKKFFVIKDDEVTESNIPDVINPSLQQRFQGFRFFKKKDKMLFFAFIPIKLSSDGVIIVYDDNGEEISELVSALISDMVEYKMNFERAQKEVDFLGDELSECESTTERLDSQVKELERQLDDLKLQMEGLEESVKILSNSRQKMLKLIDGMKNPLFSVDFNFELNNVNKALGDFTGVERLPKFIGSKCYKTIFNFDEPCPWCKVGEVVEKRESVTQHFTYVKNDRELKIEQTLYPIFDEEGELIEIGEILQDITEQFTLLKDLEKAQDKVKKISKDRINALSEISQLRQEYKALLDEYNDLIEKNKKLTLLVKNLMSESNVNELIELKKENKNLKIKLEKLHSMLERLKKEIERLKHVEEENLKKSIYSVDRLFNMITKRSDFKKEEYERVFDFIISQLKIIKNKLKIEEANNGGESSD